ncbi:hypothetical protein HanIR_Chr03g0112051 [Helianthus annuus]|nr:hypothetical protein HanIR_Chr03g0112051 [Helianthus annuus]
MRRLIKPPHNPPPHRNSAVHDSKRGVPVLDSRNVVVAGGEEHAEHECDSGGIGGGEVDVVDGDLLEGELGGFGFDSEDEDEDDSEREE